MKTDITRLLTASVYQNSVFRDKLIQFVKDPYRTIVDSPGLDSSLLIKHALNSKRRDRNYNWQIFFPAIIFWLGVIAYFTGSDGSINALITILSFTMLFALVLIWDINNRKFIQKNFQRGEFDFDFQYAGEEIELLNQFNNKTCSNVVYYSGYSPFVGNGLDDGGWSFVVDIDKGDDELGVTTEPESFTESELYDRISSELKNLNIPNFSLSDKIYFNGKKIRNNKSILPNILNHPIREVPSDLIQMAINNKVQDARFYKVAQISDWEGDLIFTAFIRFQKDANTLFVECNYFLLPPIGAQFRAIDKMQGESVVRRFIMQMISLPFVTIFHSIGSMLSIIKYGRYQLDSILGWSRRRERKIVKYSPDFDYGCFTSIRESVSQTYYEQHFQKLDKERYFKIIEKRLFNAIETFLKDKGINTSEFKERETRILNNGVFVSGGNINSENIAVGKGAKIKQSKK